MISMNPAEHASVEALKQIRHCIDNNSCFRLEAGAGAGKTYSLIESINYLISRQANLLLSNRQQIACITYTNVAKDEIKDRTDHHPVIFSDTIHAFCWSILQHYQAKLLEHIPELGEKWVQRIAGSPGINNQVVKYELGFPSINEREITLHHDDVVLLMSLMLSYPKFQKLLRSKFPIVFIDEYQDTDRNLAESIVGNLIDNDSGVMVGLFGDHWQKIYGTSACGLISSTKGKIVEIGKKANFRSDKNIVQCLNRMRPDLPQAESNPNSQGVIKVFHSNDWGGVRRDGKGGGHWKDDLPESDVKDYILKTKSLMIGDGWDFSPEKTKILFLTNNIIASEQNFKNLADCFSYTDDYLKKNDKYIKFFLEVVEPTLFAYEHKQYGELLQIKKGNHPKLKCQSDKTNWLKNLDRAFQVKTTGTIGNMLDLLMETNTPRVPSKIEDSETRFKSLTSQQAGELDDDESKFTRKLSKFHSISYLEISSLSAYIDDKTPFSTKHGVKGAQFDNVLVICGRGWNQYNWNQMLEWMDESYPADKQDTFERNRNLFYVSCSRAKHNLTLLFTQELSQKSISVLERIFGSVSSIV
ncbi:UvrD-helicase domain-containing protein [Pragia fontium]|uniref:DNA helicase-2 / ATP-dependent DNA helicase PcrA n=2 Tax=Pragia fontium TaxID=82985 RepID=A0AAJ4WAB3_9GAMM|nr:UvrD-helicase domain-containing protein [Pragia fontium]GKX62715.1 DNA helicase II [Pragia fontium]SFC75934.1 DNA helicase-2 / ATP-dependent DNA helicase PcrA [Pragia fontium DSM 5563 = ATCC 49100]